MRYSDLVKVGTVRVFGTPTELSAQVGTPSGPQGGGEPEEIEVLLTDHQSGVGPTDCEVSIPISILRNIAKMAENAYRTHADDAFDEDFDA